MQPNPLLLGLPSIKPPFREPTPKIIGIIQGRTNSIGAGIRINTLLFDQKSRYFQFSSLETMIVKHFRRVILIGAVIEIIVHE